MTGPSEDGAKKIPLIYRSSSGAVGMPLCRSLGGGLWEVRSSISGNRKTPQAELELAKKRMKEVTRS
jgi:hypothetical protein